MSTLDLDARIDSRDLIDRLSTLGVDNWCAVDYDDTDTDDRAEIDALVDALTVLYDSSEDTCEDGIFGVAESEWVDYAQEFADDTGAVPDAVKEGHRWPLYCIDWERAARDLAHAYSLVTIDGTDYYVR